MTLALDDAPVDVEAPVARGDRQRQAGAGAGRLRARDGADPIEQIREEPADVRLRPIPDRGGDDAKRQHVIGAHAGRHADQVHEAADDQARRDEQHDRDGDLRDDERPRGRGRASRRSCRAIRGERVVDAGA